MNFEIELKCNGYTLTAIMDEDNVIRVKPDFLSLNLSYEELQQLIDKLNDFKYLIDYNNKGENLI